MDMIEQPATANAAIDSLGLTITSEFIPFSLSRNAKSAPKLNDLSLNWKVTLHHHGRPILTTDYSVGCAHCPSYRHVGNYLRPNAVTVDVFDVIRSECETGRARSRPREDGIPGIVMAGGRIDPSPVDVIAALAGEAAAIDAPDFEAWASDLGYDPDSRKAESTYRACLETGLKLRAALGDDGFRRLREAFQDY